MTAPAIGVSLGGRYRLHDKIAAGGMGTVWAAEDETLHRRVAVKLLNEGLPSDPRFTERFRREARAAAGLSYPNIAGVFDYGEEDGRPYLVMELIDGETLADRLARVGRLDSEEATRIGAAVADALAHAHAAGIVHRDVKPANIMFDAADHVRVLDFGIAAPLEGATGLTATGAVMGTSRYISPEQAEGGRATPASDVYSLGVVLYEMLAGEPPFARETPVATAMAHIHERPRDLLSIRPDTPPEVAGVVHSALLKDPANRPSPDELAATLRTVASAPVRTVEIPVAATPTESIPVAAVSEPAGRTMPLRLRTPPGVIGEGRPRRTRRLRWLIGAGIVAAIVVVGALALTESGGVVKAPSLLGLDRRHAELKADRAGFKTEFHFTPSDVSRGIVVDQRPFPGRKVPSGITLFVLLSRGPDEVTEVPAPPPAPPEDHGPGKDHGKGHDKGKGPKEKH